MTGNFQSKLPSLSPDQLKKLGAFLDDLIETPAQEVDEAEQEQETKPVRRRQKQRDRGTPQARPAKPRKKIVVPDDDDDVLDSEDMDDLEDEVEENPRRSRRSTRGNPSRRAKGRQCRIEPVVLSGINKFETMPERNDARGDIEIDKKLWKGRQPTARTKERFEPIKVRCRECREIYEVSPALVYRDPESGKAKYTCDDCVASRR